MDSFSVVFKSSAEKDLRSLSKDLLVRVLQEIESLRAEPFPRDSLKLAGAERLYRVRVGDYRIVYEVDTKAKQLIIHYVRHRGAVYRRL